MRKCAKRNLKILREVMSVVIPQGMIPKNAVSLTSYMRFSHVMISYSQRQPVAIWMALSESKGRPAMKRQATSSSQSPSTSTTGDGEEVPLPVKKKKKKR